MVEALTAPSYLVKCTSLLIKANDFFHEIKFNRKTSLTECMYSPSIGVTHCFFPWSFIIVKIRHCHASNTTSCIFSFIMEIFSYGTNEKKKLLRNCACVCQCASLVFYIGRTTLIRLHIYHDIEYCS